MTTTRVSAVQVEGRLIGPGQPCFVIAEVGVNHNGDAALAHRLVDVAADAGADAVKFQTFEPDLLVTPDAEAAPYQARATGADSQRRMLASLVLPAGAWAELAVHARARGLVFLSTAFDLPSADLLGELGLPAFKVPSGELTNLPFLRALAARGLPLLVSTGMSTLEEVALAVEAAAAAPAVCLFHCVSAYPAPEADANLRAIATLRERFAVPVGWSDHSADAVTAVAAVALGAGLLEKHITLDRAMPGPDHSASSDPEQFAAYLSAVRTTEAALGDGVKRPRPSEEENRVHARRGLHAARALRTGDALDADDVVALRPATGLSPGTALDGLRVLRDLPAGAPLRAADIGRA